jgi:Zn-dependent M28 family amino/carboxypeptidase
VKLNKRIFPNQIFIIIAVILTLLVVVIAVNYNKIQDEKEEEFNSKFAYEHIENQVKFGPRYTGSLGHIQVQDYIVYHMKENGWNIEIQIGETNGHEIRNIICTKGEGNSSILIGAHYDTRKFSTSEQEPEFYIIPVEGANDGASGVAVLLELARVIPEDINNEIIFVFFDQEDGGGFDGADWAMGSRYYVENLEEYPDKVIIIDMIGDLDLNIYRELNSSKLLLDEIWQTAAELGFDEFIDEEKYSMLDDHSPFINKGINTALIIDFSYPYWHTNEDTIDKVSGASLKIVGDTILAWINKEMIDE